MCTLKIMVSSMLLIAEWKINYEVKLLKYPQNLFLYYLPVSKLHFFYYYWIAIILFVPGQGAWEYILCNCLRVSFLSPIFSPQSPFAASGETRLSHRDNWYESHYPLEEIILSQICFSSMSVVRKPYMVLCEFYIGLIPPKFTNWIRCSDICDL